MNEVKTFAFNYEGTEITFETNGEVLINATEMIKAFPSKRMSDFTTSQQTKSFIQALNSKAGIPVSQIMLSKKGNSSLFEQGTWMHRKLALKFAAWLSPEFELWVYDRIEELGKYGFTAMSSTLDEMISNPDLVIGLATQLKEERRVKEMALQQVSLQQQQLKEAAPKVQYHDEVLQSESLITTTVIAKELGMSGEALNKKLHALNIQFKVGNTWVLYSKYQNLGLTKTKTHKYNDKEGKEQTNIQTYWTEKGREFVHGKIKGSYVYQPSKS